MKTGRARAEHVAGRAKSAESETRSAFANVYDDPDRASAYATLDYPGTYYLAFRDLPAILARHVRGRRALDFGCGAGRSTRFLKSLGYDARGVDISASMVRRAVELDPAGEYHVIANGESPRVAGREFDLILSMFTFDNIPTAANRQNILCGLRDLLAPEGRIVMVGSRPEIYWHEWASFTTSAFPANRQAGSGEPVRIVMKDVADARPVIDLLWTHEDYLDLFARSGLTLLDAARPLGRPDEPYPWISEVSVAPWSTYVLSAGS